MSVSSNGSEPLYRNYSFVNSTIPILPTNISITEVTSTSVKFCWMPPAEGFLQKVIITTQPSDGNCPCFINGSVYNETTIVDLIPGNEYEFAVFSESKYGRRSRTFKLTQSLFTDDVISWDIAATDDAIEFQVQLGAGFGDSVVVNFERHGYPNSSRKHKFHFGLHILIRFDNLIPGCMYKWNVTSTSRGSNPLVRYYGQFENSTLPATPLKALQAAAGVLFVYDTFQLDIGALPSDEYLVDSIRFTWIQRGTVHQFKVKLITLGTEELFDLEAGGWSRELRMLSLEPGTSYDIEVIPISYGKEGESLTLSEYTLLSAIIENRAARRIESTELDLQLSYDGTVEKVYVRLDPPDGNCPLSCEIIDPATTFVVQLTGLTPGQNYSIEIQGESNGILSASTTLNQSLPPGEILWREIVTGTNTSLLKFQMPAGKGSYIMIQYNGKTTGHKEQFTYPYR
ncbi:receptor-type tyrosine-protein phosphatase eta-like [Convolutriloba macropyga]|uniref:receptor-type tyrosine-protein phosphatase eta-like n=1 Tax=Convolutriloba macropyga TaxID=536237 RepID=UPI003F525ADA